MVIKNIKSKVVEDLVDIIKNTPLALRPLIKQYKALPGTNQYLECVCMGITRRMPWRKIGASFVVDTLGFNEYGIGLSYNCDDMPETLLHEALHVRYNSLEELDIIHLTEFYSNNERLRKACQKRVIERLGELNL